MLSKSHMETRIAYGNNKYWHFEHVFTETLLTLTRRPRYICVCAQVVKLREPVSVEITDESVALEAMK